MFHPQQVAGAWAERHPGAVISGRYASPPTGKSLLRIVQENEFARDGRAINRRGNKTRIVVGTSALFSVATLRAIIRARLDGILPGPRVGEVYSTASITEDYELTLALRTLGYPTLSPPECDAVTDVMPTIPALWRQRIRWQRGAFTDLRTYGLNRVTAWYYAAQAMWVFGMLTVLLIVVQVAPGRLAQRALQPGTGVDRHAAAVHGAPDLVRPADGRQGHARRRRAHPRDGLRLLPLRRVPVLRLAGHDQEGRHSGEAPPAHRR